MEEEVVEEEFEVFEIDLDYEYDAVQFFDLSRLETIEEALEAERWFQTAPTYPPSPLVLKLNFEEDFFLENANTSQKPENAQSMVSTSSDMDVGMDSEDYLSHESREPEFHNQEPKAAFRPRSSTLMKPTISHLAKLKNRPQESFSSRFLGRFQRQHASGNFSETASRVAADASKRQKLEKGYLRKAGCADANSKLSRSNATIPRGPHLQTAQRAQRQRTRSNKDSSDPSKMMAHTIKLRGLNSKVEYYPDFLLFRQMLEAPKVYPLNKSASQLPDLEVTSQCCLLVKNALNMSSTAQTIIPEVKRLRPTSGNASKLERCQPVFKAHSLNKKIFSSKGEMGVFRNVKREVTVPNEFKLSTAKQAEVSQLESSWPTEDLKENTPSYFQHGKVEANVVKEKAGRLRLQESQCGSDMRMVNSVHRRNINRNSSEWGGAWISVEASRVLLLILDRSYFCYSAELVETLNNFLESSVEVQANGGKQQWVNPECIADGREAIHEFPEMATSKDSSQLKIIAA
ncbi:TPX2 central domain [Dillenia turbinata]|uniref:TPX2 central domain n=1 Tax=Dillenia turbinata TaxID=194707 RepID=A0AAN8VV59_9MAGN